MTEILTPKIPHPVSMTVLMENQIIPTPSLKGCWYVYRLQSIDTPSFGYTGLTSNLHHRLQQHNRRENRSTARYAPFNLIFAATFPDKFRALAFEAYLKSGSGHAFAKKRLW